MFAIILGNCLHWIKQQSWTRVLVFLVPLCKLGAGLVAAAEPGCLLKPCLPKAGKAAALGCGRARVYACICACSSDNSKTRLGTLPRILPPVLALCKGDSESLGGSA